MGFDAGYLFGGATLPTNANPAMVYVGARIFAVRSRLDVRLPFVGIFIEPAHGFFFFTAGPLAAAFFLAYRL